MARFTLNYDQLFGGLFSSRSKEPVVIETATSQTAPATVAPTVDESAPVTVAAAPTQTAPVQSAPAASAPAQASAPQASSTTEGGRASGLYAQYFALADNVTSLDQIDFDAEATATGAVASLNTIRSDAAFWQDGPADHFAARFTGTIEVEEGGRYTFYLTSDDGSALYVDGVQVIDNDGLHGTMGRRVRLDLDPGEHDIELRYFERDGEQSLRLEWRGPDSNNRKVVLEGDALSHAMPDVTDSDGDDTDTGTDTGTDGDDTDTGTDTGTAPPRGPFPRSSGLTSPCPRHSLTPAGCLR